MKRKSLLLLWENKLWSYTFLVIIYLFYIFISNQKEYNL